MPESMIERVGTAINHATRYTSRRNKAKSPGSQYEVVKLDDDGDAVVVDACGDRGVADIIVDALNDESRARAAIASMREPTMEMIAEGQDAIEESVEFTQDSYERYPVFSISPMAHSGWTAMIDQALKGKEG